MRTLGVIPARGGSTRIPRKNLELLGGIPLVYHALMHCWHSEILRPYCAVSTDSVDIAMACAHEYRSPMVIERTCGSDGPMVDVLIEVLSKVYGEYEAVCCVQPTSPFRDGRDIDACIEILEATPQSHSIVSVDESTGERNGAVYVTRVSMLRDALVFDDNSLTYAMPHTRSLDINTPADLELARKMWAEKHG